MRKSLYILGLFLVIFGGILSGCSSAAAPTAPAAQESGNAEPPAEYAGKTAPASSDPAAGSKLFASNCSSCHGETGLGDGPASTALKPAPQNLAKSQKSLSDAYLYWRIAEGGTMEPFRSSMPSWKGILKEDQIWAVISFIRSLEG